MDVYSCSFQNWWIFCCNEGIYYSFDGDETQEGNQSEISRDPSWIVALSKLKLIDVARSTRSSEIQKGLGWFITVWIVFQENGIDSLQWHGQSNESVKDDKCIFFTCHPVASFVGMKWANAAPSTTVISRLIYHQWRCGETALARRVHDSNLIFESWPNLKSKICYYHYSRRLSSLTEYTNDLVLCLWCM